MNCTLQGGYNDEFYLSVKKGREGGGRKEGKKKVYADCFRGKCLKQALCLSLSEAPSPGGIGDRPGSCAGRSEGNVRATPSAGNESLHR